MIYKPNEETYRFNKYQKKTELYFDLIHKNCDYPPILDGVSLKITKKLKIILIEVSDVGGEGRCFDEVWYYAKVLRKFYILLKDLVNSEDLKNEYKNVRVTIKKPFFSSQKKVIISGEGFEHLIKCKRVELIMSKKYSMKDNVWTLIKKPKLIPLTKEEEEIYGDATVS